MLTERRSLLTWFKPKQIDRYVLGEVTGLFLGGLAFFIFILLMFQFLRLADFLINHGVSGLILTELTFYLAMSFLPTSVPVAFLLALLMTMGRLSSDSELVAIKASGVSVFRLSYPLFGAAALVGLISLTLNLNLIPRSERAFRNLLVKVRETKVSSSIKEGAFTSGFFDLLIFADKVDHNTNRLHRVFIFDEREAKNPLSIIARSGEILSLKDRNGLGDAAILRLYDGSIHRNDLQGQTYQKIDFGEYRLYLKIQESVEEASTRPHMIRYRDLEKGMRETDVSTREGREVRIEFWRRWATAIAPFVFVFLGIAFGSVRVRAVRAGAALSAFIILMSYWSIQTATSVAALKGQMEPWLAMLFPNLIFLPVGLVGFKRASW